MVRNWRPSAPSLGLAVASGNSNSATVAAGATARYAHGNDQCYRNHSVQADGGDHIGNEGGASPCPIRSPALVVGVRLDGIGFTPGD